MTQIPLEPSADSTAAEERSEPWRMPQPPVVPGGKPIRQADGMNRSEQKAAALLRARLAQFYLPSVAIRGKTLDAEIAEIWGLMEKSDHGGALQENPISLLGDQDSESDQTVSLVRGNLSVLGALELLMIQAGKRLVFSADGVEMAEFVAVPDAPMVTRTFDISSVPELQGVSPYILPAPVAVTAGEGATTNLEVATEVAEFEGFVSYGSPIAGSDGTVLGGAGIVDPIFAVRGGTPAEQLEMWGVPLVGRESASLVEG